MSDWYYAAGGQQLGPVPLSTLQGMLSSGQLQAEDLVWREGMANWTAARMTPELAASAAPVPVAQPQQAPQPLAGEWHYAHGGQQQGPVPGATLVQLLVTGQISAEAPVWRDGMPDWQPAHAVPEVARAFAAASAPVAGYYGAPGQVNYYTPSQVQLPYAGFWIRFCAAFIDGLIISAPFTVLGIIVEGGFNNPNPTPAQAGLSLLINLASLIAGWLYEALQTSGRHMATFGKRAVGIRVTDMHGNRISFGRATGRHFAKIISGCILLIGYIMAAFTERKQALHDIMASTLVVQGAAPK